MPVRADSLDCSMYASASVATSSFAVENRFWMMWLKTVVMLLLHLL